MGKVKWHMIYLQYAGYVGLFKVYCKNTIRVI